MPHKSHGFGDQYADRESVGTYRPDWAVVVLIPYGLLPPLRNGVVGMRKSIMQDQGARHGRLHVPSAQHTPLTREHSVHVICRYARLRSYSATSVVIYVQRRAPRSLKHRNKFRRAKEYPSNRYRVSRS
jgi:hypothetical protein